MPDNDQFQVAQLIEGPLQFEEPPKPVAPEQRNEPLAGPLQFEAPEKPAPLSDEQRARKIDTLKETATDTAKSAGAGLARALPAIAIGGIGSIESTAGDVYKFGRDLFYKGQEALDLISPEAAAKAQQAPLRSGMTEMQQKGYSSPITHIPTYKGVIAAEKDIAKKLKIPGLGYEAKTTQGKIGEKLGEGAAMGVPGGIRTAAGRILAGGLSGAAGEAAAQATTGQPNQPFWSLAAALGGGFAGASLANAILPKVVGREELAQALQKDFRTGQTKMSPEELREHIAAGRDVTLIDIAGPNAMTYIQKAAGTSAMNHSRAQQFNAELLERNASAVERIEGTIEKVFGQRVDASKYAEALERSGQSTRDQVFSLARANPNAAAIPSASLVDLQKNPAFAKSVEDTIKNTASMKDKYNIVAPEKIPGKPGTASRWEQTPRGLVERKGTPAVPETTVDGNLNFWHQVDRDLGEKIQKARREGSNMEAGALADLQSKLRAKINARVPEYEKALAVSAKTFQGASAPEAGFNFANRLFGAVQNPFRRQDVKADFARMPAENKEALAIGAVHAIQQRIARGDLSTVAKKFNDKNFQRDMQVILGPDRYHQIRGAVMAENALKNVPPISPVGSGAGYGSAAGAGAATAYIAESLPNMLSMPSISPDLATKMLVAAGVGAAAKGSHDAFRRRVANNIIPLVFSKDPKDLARLSRYAEESPLVGQIFNRMNATLATAITQQRQRLENEEAPKKRASGGRISSEVDRAAENLVRSVEKARESHSGETKQFLSHPDEAIVKALAMANEAI